jgi:hypothetical protein
MRNASGAITCLYHEAAELCRHFAETNNQIRQIGDCNPCSSDLKCQLETLRTRILRLYGVLGVHSPDVSPTLANLISPDGINSSEYRRKFLTLEEVFGRSQMAYRGSPRERISQRSWINSGFTNSLTPLKCVMLMSYS